ncbi:MAG: Crp/Fnr family transcriptional regulator [Proteobacteria bacterium]|nr:Crp/Fnr family transcriptional regulator [Pseudomonadota bacterium]
MAKNWIEHFPGLDRLPSELRGQLIKDSSVIALAAGSRIYGPGQAPRHYLLMLDGTVRVQQVSESGREIVLYRVTSGESCVLTTACLMGYEDYLAEAVAETDIHAVAIPRKSFDELIAGSADFRRFVFTAFSTRVTNLFRIIDELAFARMDIRLAGKLLELSRGSREIAVTQQQLAAELGSAREVVGRILSKFQQRGFIALTRGSITLLDRSQLEALQAS